MAEKKKKPEETGAGESGSTHSLRDNAEKQLVHSRKISPDIAGQTSEQLIHELQVHQIELEVQADQLRVAQLALEESRDKYLDLYEFAPLAYVTLNDKALVTGVNLTCATLLGVERNEIINHGLGRFIADGEQDVWDRYFAEVRQNKEKQISTLTLRRKDGSTFPARLEGACTIVRDGTVVVRIAISDITDIWQIEVLRESENRYRAIYHKSPIAIELYDAAGTLVHANPACMTLFGIEDILVIRNFSLFADPNISDEQKENLHRGESVQYQGPFDFNKVKTLNLYPTSREGIIWLDVLITPLGERADSVTGFLVQIQDITARISTEKILHESEIKHRALFNAIADTVFLIDQKSGSIVDVNPEATRVYGFSHNEFIKMNAADVSAEPKKTARALEMPVPHIPLRYHRHKDGTIFPVELTASTFEMEGKTTIIATARDITDRKRAEDLIQTSETRYRRLFEAAQDGILILNRTTGEISDSNPFIETLTGYTKGELVGKPLWEIGFIKDQALSRIAFEELQTKEYIRYEDLPLETKDGRRIEVEFVSNVYPIDPHTSVIQCNIRDITDRKRLEDTLQISSKKLKLLSSITRHDINNQLAVLQGYLSLFEMQQPDPKLNEYLHKVTTAAERISTMIRFTKEYENIGVNAPVWQGCRTLLATAAKEAPLGQVLVKNDLPAGAEVCADPLVVKVFYNLMDNAVRYGGKITNIRFFVEEHEGNHLIICEDDGDGVVAEEKEKIFERGFGKNTGLGLSLSREILDITGITICEKGEPGKGARFEITVPKGMWRMNGASE